MALAFPACGSVKPPVKSILRLGDLHPDGTLHEFCSSWATRYKDGTVKWISAAHCILAGSDGKPDMDIKYKIGGKDAELVAWDLDKDLSVFSGPMARPLQIAYDDAEVGDKVYTIAYFWQGTALYTEGVASGKGDTKGHMIFNLTAGPGASGAPVLIKGNLVVGIIQYGPTAFPGPVMGGIGVDLLREFIIGW